MGLDDVNWLNDRLKLDGDRHLVPFAPIHLRMMELDKFEKGYLESFDNYEATLEVYAQLGFAYTGVVAGRPICSFGAIVLWPGVAEMWLVPDKRLGRYARTFHRATIGWINILMAELHLVRLQVTVHTGNDRADKWIRSLYFQREGVLRRFGPEGADYAMYSRLPYGRPVQLTESTASAAGP